LPMVVFCIDISASMSSTTSAGSRLQCVQSAVLQQLDELHKQHPECVAVVITFGAEVCVYTDHGNSAKVARTIHEDPLALREKGEELSDSCSESVEAVIDRLRATVKGLRPCGNTALGPALSVAVGLASSKAGSKIVLCTDGMANNGVGAIKNRSLEVPFYGDIARRAAEDGTVISVVTMEGEDCSMENLGVCADLTGGLVEMVDLQLLGSKMSAMLADPSVATGLEVSLILGHGASLRSDMVASSNGRATTSTWTVGNVTSKTAATLRLDLSDALVAVPIQMQLRYTRPSGEQVLQTITVQQTTSSNRVAVLEDIDGTAVGLEGVHSAARLAQQGKYREARVQLISTCRLLQRAMRSLAHQEAYLCFIVQAEKLDGFMRERESQEKVFGSDGSAQRGRDDDASRSMYQMKTLSVKEFTSRSV